MDFCSEGMSKELLRPDEREVKLDMMKTDRVHIELNVLVCKLLLLQPKCL